MSTCSFDNLSEYTDEELQRKWDHLEKLALTYYIEKLMDAVQEEQSKRILRKECGNEQ